MEPIELFGWSLSTLLTAGFAGSLFFMSRKPKLLSESEYRSSQKRYHESNPKSSQ
ncbi:hypothetical protein [Domibacillus robiginosus]|uniref:hypothetical protein n=1 Tax=Domibacillus robiginosus TaxID=1071054 RepID=UPI000A5861BF|nr:hypothetical protein [Domibacillus robiginosus]